MAREYQVAIPEIHEFHYTVIADDESEAIEIAMAEYFKDPRLIKDCKCDDEMLEEPIVYSDIERDELIHLRQLVKETSTRRRVKPTLRFFVSVLPVQTAYTSYQLLRINRIY